MSLRDKYNEAIQTAKQVRMQGAADERDGKLYFHGTVDTQDHANKIWDAIKSVPDWRIDVVGDLKTSAAPSSGAQPERTYTVKAGDTLSKIAKAFYGDAGNYSEVFNANRDQLADPNTIQPGQVLRIPQPSQK
jgi:nucleoid-associated protein YgaU